MIERLVRSADFERVLRTRTRVNSVHFAVHHVADRPSTSRPPAAGPDTRNLSTAIVSPHASAVDDCHPQTATAALSKLWLGAVVPKRHARRSVTRSLLKRQIRAAVCGHRASLPGGLWVVRLRAPFDRIRFVSAASDELRRAARDELESLMSSAAQRGAAR